LHFNFCIRSEVETTAGPISAGNNGGIIF
jgi:hypothetical protein